MSLDAAWVAPVILSYCTNKSCKCGLWHCWNLSLRSSFPMTSVSKRWNGTAASLAKWQSGSSEVLAGQCTLVWACNATPRLCWVQGPMQRCAEHLCICFILAAVYFMLTLVADWLLNTAVFARGNTLQVYTRKAQQLSVTAGFWDVGKALIPLCVTERQGCMVLSLPGGMSLGRESVSQALTQTRSLSRVSGRNQIVKTCPYHFSTGCLTKIKVKLRGRKYTLLNILEWNPKVTSSGNTAAELKPPVCSACVHNDYDRCVFSFKLAFYLRIFFPVKQTNVFWLRFLA